MMKGLTIFYQLFIIDQQRCLAVYQQAAAVCNSSWRKWIYFIRVATTHVLSGFFTLHPGSSIDSQSRVTQQNM